MVERTADRWTPNSWMSKPVSQQIKYGDPQALQQVVEKLCQLPPLVSSSEVDALKTRISEAQAGQRFIVQGGDCAESFSDCNADAISQKVRSLLSLSLLVSQKTQQPITRIGRIAGQYAKPRFSPYRNARRDHAYQLPWRLGQSCTLYRIRSNP